MKKLLFGVALFGVALLAQPASTAFAAGVDFVWNECLGAATDTSSVTFLCTGTLNKNYNLICQMKVAADLPNFGAATAIIDLQRQGPAVAQTPFWHYEDTGCQRSGTIKGLAMQDNPALILPADAVNGCVAQETNATLSDPWGGDGSGGTEGIAVYAPDNPTPGRARLVLIDAATGPSPLAAGVNYYMFHLTFNNKNRTACPGCTDSYAGVLNSMTLESTDGSQPTFLFTVDKSNDCGLFSISPGAGGTALCNATPTRNTTWGQLKSMYR